MSEIAERYRKVAGQFTERARSVPVAGWDNPSPCEGWVARDIVRHMVGWMPRFFLGNIGAQLPKVPSVNDDPVGAWEAVDRAIQAALDEPETAAREFDMQAGRHTLEHAVGLFGIGDVLIHTWDLARATGLDDTLDADEVHQILELVQSNDELVRGEHFGPRVEVPADADEQTKLIALTGRRPQAAL